MIKVNYPDRFHEFNGVKIIDKEINIWIKKGINYLEEHKDENFYRISGGDTMIVIFKYSDNPLDEYKYSYEIDVCKNRYELTVDVDNT